MELSQRQAEIYQFILDYHQQKGYSPTLREIAVGVEVSLSTVMAHIQAMKDKGRIDWEPNSARSIHVVKQNGSSC
jgi:repressor LexA